MLLAEELFDAGYYLSTNSDVAAALSRGEISSAEAHFNQFGRFERRDPSAYFDTDYYLQQYQDVANAVNAGITTAFAHFINNGQLEGRNPDELFDNNYYLQQYQDVAAAVANDQLTGIEHFVEFGDFEGRAGSPFIDPGYYLGRNADVAQAVGQRTIGVTEHFIEFGSLEGRVPRKLFSQVYLFGDSQSDDGNLYNLIGGLLPVSPPYYNGRFSNGPVWVEYFVPQVGLAYDPALNVAIGGAETGTNDVPVPGLPNGPNGPGLQRQIDTFTAANPSADPNALYIVYAGGNDYFAGVTDVGPTVNNLATAVTKLAAIGARNFLMPNLPNPSGSPLVISRGPEAVELRTDLVNRHAAALAATIQNLEQNPNINIIPVDFTSRLREVRANPQNFGLVSVGGVVPGDSFDADLVRGFTVPPEVNPDQYMYWDQVHLSTRTHQLISETALKATTAIPEVLEIL